MDRISSKARGRAVRFGLPAIILGTLAVTGLSTAGRSAEPIPTPTVQPLPTRRPTPAPQVTPSPMKLTRVMQAGNALRLDGVVAGNPGRVDFFFRAGGTTYRVVPYKPDLCDQIHGGDGVRVYGFVNGQLITNANVRTTGSRASNSPEDYGKQETRHGLTGTPNR